MFVFNAKTKRRKKQRVSATADLGSEVPNLGVARALFVILVLHVAAIAAIFIHNRVTDDTPITSTSEETASASLMGRPAVDKLPVVQKGEPFYFLGTGDTYERIAQAKGVDVNELRDLNNNVKLKAGRILRIPAGGNPSAAAVASIPPEPAPVAPAPPVAPPSTPVAAPDPIAAAGINREAAVVVQRESLGQPFRVQAEDPIKVTPNVRPVVEAPGPAVPATSVATPVATGGAYAVKSGDTLWGIAHRHKVSVKSLLTANGITDAKKLRIGMKLRIPSN